MATALTLLVAFGAGFLSPTPPLDRLPDAALGSPLLLHIERSAALLGISGITFVVVFRALRGELPIRVAHLEYEARQTGRLANHEQRLRHLEAATGIRREVENGDEPS